MQHVYETHYFFILLWQMLPHSFPAITCIRGERDYMRSPVRFVQISRVAKFYHHVLHLCGSRKAIFQDIAGFVVSSCPHIDRHCFLSFSPILCYWVQYDRNKWSARFCLDWAPTRPTHLSFYIMNIY